MHSVNKGMVTIGHRRVEGVQLHADEIVLRLKQVGEGLQKVVHLIGPHGAVS